MPHRDTANDRSLHQWLRAEAVNLRRHAVGLGPFPEGSFGRGPTAPARAHLAAVNDFVLGMQRALVVASRELDRRTASAGGGTGLDDLLALRDETKRLVDATEKVWDFYFRIFTQRRTVLGPMLLAADRIALDCYQAVFLGLGVARSIPSPPPLSYMHGERGAATFRRGVVIALLGHRANPFPLVKLPYHRLLNAWTLGAVPHEVAHNLQSDLDLWEEIPRRIDRALRRAGVGSSPLRTWTRWHKELFADLAGVLLIGPAYARSLTEVVSRSRDTVRRWNPAAVHPTPYLRPLVSFHLLERLGFRTEVDVLQGAWDVLYPARSRSSIPVEFQRTFVRATRVVVDTICFTSYRQLGGRRLADVVAFTGKEHALTREAAGRLARGVDPGVVPGRFLIGASRMALDDRLAEPAVINRNFYRALTGR